MNMHRKVPGNEGALASSTNILVAWANRALTPTNSSSDVHFVRWYTACTGTGLNFNIFTMVLMKEISEEASCRVY